MFEMITDVSFVGPVLFGLLGIGLWILVTYFDPSDDRITASFRVAMLHTRPMTIGLISYLMLCVMAYRNDELTDVMAICMGYANHSLVVKLFDTVGSRLQSRLTKEP
jgi:hypothetical protein